MIALSLAIGAIACERKPAGKPAVKFHSEETLHQDATGKLTYTTHYTEGVVGIPVWQVWHYAAGASAPTPLLTAERVWQEPVPASPTFFATGSELVVRDKPRSYVYSLRRRTFTHNAHPNSVYAGAYQR